MECAGSPARPGLGVADITSQVLLEPVPISLVEGLDEIGGVPKLGCRRGHVREPTSGPQDTPNNQMIA
jgi:hypothetical protein